MIGGRTSQRLLTAMLPVDALRMSCVTVRSQFGLQHERHGQILLGNMLI